MKKIYILIVIVVLLTACSPSASQMEVALKETISAIPTSTLQPTYTSYPTYTTVPTYTPEVIVVTATSSPTPKFTPTITNTPTKTATATNTPPPTKSPGIFDTFSCGNYFDIKVSSDPWFAKAAGSEKASGEYLIFRLEIVNKTSTTWDRIPDESYQLTGVVDGNEISFALNWDSTWFVSYRYGVKNATTDQLPPGVSFDTYVGFDVNPAGTDWKFIFAPAESFLDDPVCKVTIPLKW